MTYDMSVFDPVRRALDECAPASQLSLWLRDDDAIAASRALSEFEWICRDGGVSPLMAVIPDGLQLSLVGAADSWPCTWTVGVHGLRHVNRAGVGRKKSEFPEGLDLATLSAELESGFERLSKAFDRRFAPIFIPPWNRIAPFAAAALKPAGYAAVSTFAAAHVSSPPPGVAVVNTHIDLIDWRGGRTGKPIVQIADELAAAVKAGQVHIGVLTHHLDHDPTANASLAGLIDFVCREPRLTWLVPREVFELEV